MTAWTPCAEQLPPTIPTTWLIQVTGKNRPDYLTKRYPVVYVADEESRLTEAFYCYERKQWIHWNDTMDEEMETVTHWCDIYPLPDKTK